MAVMVDPAPAWRSDRVIKQATHARRIELSSRALDRVVILSLVSANLHAVTHPTLSKGTAQRKNSEKKTPEGEEREGGSVSV